jgi:hypothetical protein
MVPMGRLLRYFAQTAGCALTVAGLIAHSARAEQFPADPNLPGPVGRYVVPGGTGLYWVYLPRPPGVNPLAPVVCFLPVAQCGQQNSGEYLGYVDGKGSLIQRRVGAVYLFDGRTLVRQYDSVDGLPPDVLAALRNRQFTYNSVKDRFGAPPDAAVEALPARIAIPSQRPDPNLPANLGNDSQTGFPLGWQLFGTTTQPSLMVIRPAGPAAGAGLYLGFNERGSWLVSTGDTRVYVWNLQAKSVSLGVANAWEAPLDLANPSPLMLAILYYDAHRYSISPSKGPAPDPNFPPTLAGVSQSTLPVSWEYPDYLHPGNTVSNLLVQVYDATRKDEAAYLGFNERGAWIRDKVDLHIYVWNFKTLKLTLLASRLSNVPKDVIASLHNADPMMLARIVAAHE